MAVKITQNGITKTLPEAHEVNDRINHLLEKNGGIKVYATLNSFPKTGFSNLLYRAEDTDLLYCWSRINKKYEPIGNSGELPQIQVIHGGTAKGTTNK